MIPKRLRSDIHGRNVDLHLGRLNVLFAPSEFGKSRVSVAAEFAGTGKVDGWWGRVGVSEPTRLATFAGPGRSGWKARLDFDDGTWIERTLTGTPVKASKPVVEGDAVARLEALDDLIMPQRAVMAALYEAGDDRQRQFLLRAAARDVTEDDVLGVLPEAARKAWSVLCASVRAKAGQKDGAAVPIEALLSLITRAKEQVKKGAAELGGMGERLLALEEHAAAAGPDRPTPELIEAATARAAAAGRSIESISAAYDWARGTAAFGAARAALVEAEARLAEAGSEEETAPAEPEGSGGSDARADRAKDRDRVELLGHLHVAAELSAKYNLVKCGLCTTPYDARGWSTRAEALGEAEQTARVRSGADPSSNGHGGKRQGPSPHALLREAVAQAKGRAVARRDALVELRERIRTDKAAGRLSPELPTVDLDVPLTEAIRAAGVERGKLETEVARLRQVAADWDLIDKRRTEKSAAEAAQRDAEAIATAIGDATTRALTLASGRYATRVEKYLPTGYKLHLRFQYTIPKGPRSKAPPEVKDTCEIGIIRPDGTIALNPSGVQQNYLLFALTCVSIEDRPDAWVLVVPQDVGADQKAMSRMMQAWENAPAGVTVLWETATLPEKVPASWVVHDVSAIGPAPAEAVKKTPRKKGGKGSETIAAAVDEMDLEGFTGRRQSTGDDADDDLDVDPGSGKPVADVDTDAELLDFPPRGPNTDDLLEEADDLLGGDVFAGSGPARSSEGSRSAVGPEDDYEIF